MPVTPAAVAAVVFDLFGGGTVERFVDSELGAPVDLVRAPGSPGPGVTSWGTVGAHAFDTGLALADGRAWRLELLAVADDAATGFGAAVAECALALLDAPGPVAAGALLPGVIAAHVPDTSTPHALLVEPVSWPQPPADLDAADEVVEFLQVVPITDDELVLARMAGVAAVVEVFAAAEPPVADLHRASVLAPA